MNDQALKDILLSLLAEIQRVRVDQALLKAELSGDKTVGNLVEAQRKAERNIHESTKELVSKIEAIA